jgi:hypothetical protein
MLLSNRPRIEEDGIDMLHCPVLAMVGEAIKRAVMARPRACSAHGPPKAGPLAKPPQAGGPPAIRPTVDTSTEWLKNQVPVFKAGARVVGATLEVDRELREEDVSEDAGLVELTHAAYGRRKWSRSCMLALVTVPVIFRDGMKMRIRKKLQPMDDFWPRLQKALGEEQSLVQLGSTWPGSEVQALSFPETKRRRAN